MSQFVINALYKFVYLPDFEAMQRPLQDVCDQHEVKGTLLLAEEGINGTIAGTREGVDAVFAHLRADPRLADLTGKESYHKGIPFYRMKVRLKNEIVTLGLPEVDPTELVGTYVDPQAWNELISDPDVLLIDTRNDFEVEIGTFEGAQNPHTAAFRDFPTFTQKYLDANKHKKIAMFCTGGIRCEKATSYLLGMGFPEVYHLKGGILQYLEDVPEEQSMWHGECFVFDNRVTVDHQLQQGSYSVCRGCQHPLSPEDQQSPHYEQGVQCPYCYQESDPGRKNRFRERQKQIQLAEERGEIHIGRRF